MRLIYKDYIIETYFLLENNKLIGRHTDTNGYLYRNINGFVCRKDVNKINRYHL